MKMVKKATLVAVIATGLILFFVPLPASGGGCGGSNESSASSGCQSQNQNETVAPESNRDVDGLIMRHASIGEDLNQDLASLESRVILLTVRADSDELRTECEELRNLVVTIRDNISQYQVIGNEIMSAMGHGGRHGKDGQAGSAMSAYGDHDH
jgi:hypothetical protein